MPSIFLRRCPSCAEAVDASSRFCPACGSRLEPLGPAGATEALPSGTRPRTPDTLAIAAGAGAGTGEEAGAGAAAGSGEGPGASSSGADPFVPGTVLAKRYRIVGILGRGGMGEIYRADDMRLGQPVALKFLPRFLARRREMRERFRAEVRLARQVSHPNVCTVYDIGEVEGRPFMSMEYVDGEDLASLLRRIGRLEPGKAVEIARQICAGLAAAHAQGILHRDLKPANIMLNGHGQVRITDFGLASLVEEHSDRDLMIGTPAYMPPEQVEGEAATPRSDLYSLGLVLFELFTGKPVFEGETLHDLVRMQRDEPPPRPSELVEGLDPIVEDVILRCLEKNPEDRPPSAAAVAAGLPGTDPLHAVVAAGETPSPAMVAAAGSVGAIRPLVGLGCVLVVVAGLLAAFLFARETQAVHRAPLPRSCDFLVDRARGVLRAAGVPADPADYAYGITHDPVVFRALYGGAEGGPGEEDAAGTGLSPGAAASIPHVRFWYRESPERMAWFAPASGGPGAGTITFDRPPRDVPGMAGVVLDPSGWLLRLNVVPPREGDATAPAAEPDWPSLFRLAGLDLDRFRPTASRLHPERFADARRAWEGTRADLPGAAIRVEAASLGGRPLSFRVETPWDDPVKDAEGFAGFPAGRIQRIAMRVAAGAMLAVLAGMILMARRNLRRARGDRRGAWRLAVLTGSLVLARWLFIGHHVASGSLEFLVLASALAWSLLAAALMWVLYVALEPSVRRAWPGTVISWSRLLAGRFRDPLVGRDVLFGAGIGVLWVLLVNLRILVPGWVGRPDPPPLLADLEVLLGVRYVAGWFAGMVVRILFEGLAAMFLFVLVRILLRKRWLASAVALALFSFTSPLVRGVFDSIGVGFAVLGAALLMVSLFRFGLVATLAGFAVVALLTGLPLTPSLSTWDGRPAIVALFSVLGLVAYAFVTAVGRRSLIPDEALED